MAQAGVTVTPPSGAGQSVLLQMPVEQAYERLIGALQATGSEVGAQAPPHSVGFVGIKQSFWATMGARVRFPGVATLTPTQGGTTLQLSATVDWNSAMLIFISYGVAFLVSFLFVNQLMAVFIAIAGPAITYFQLNSSTRDQVLREIITQTAGLASPVAAPAAAAAAAAAAPAPSSVPAAQPPPEPTLAAATEAAAEDDADDSLAQIERLARLRDSGAITAEEFDAKKAELLKRV